LKFVPEDQLNVHMYLSSLFCDFPLIARSGTIHVTVSLIGCDAHLDKSLVLKNLKIAGI